MAHFHHQRLPNHSTLLSGRVPPDEVGFQSDQLQIWFNNTDESWVGEGELPHKHLQSDECFLILEGSIEVQVDGDTILIGAGEFCCFQAGVLHAVVSVKPPIQSLVIRAPSVEDKVYVETV